MKALLAFCLLAPLAHAQTFVPGGVISTDTTWGPAGSPYILEGDLFVYGSALPVLTVEAGVEVRSQAGVTLHVGYSAGVHSAYRGELDVQGTAMDPVLFTADNGMSGGWEGIQFNDASDYLGSSSSLEHCVIEKAVRCVTVIRSDQPVMQDVELNDASEYPVHFSGAALLTMGNVSLAGNADNRVLYDGVITDSLEIDTVNWPLPLVFGDVSIYSSANPRVTIAPGSELRFLPGSVMDVGRDHASESASFAGSLLAQGTAGQPITFTADDNSVGGWTGLRFNNSSDYDGTTSLLEHCVVEMAVRNVHAKDSDTPVLQDVELNDSSEWPLYLEGAGLPGNSGVSASGNPDNRAYYTGLVRADRTIDVAASSLPVVFGNISIYDNTVPTLTIAAGSELRFLPGSRVDVGYINSIHNVYRGGLEVQGTLMDPVLFTADNDLSGGWEGIRFNDASDFNGAASSMSYCTVEKAVRCIWSRSTSAPTLDHVSLNDSGEWPLYLEGASLPTPIALSGSGNPDNRGLYTGALQQDWTCDLANWSLPLLFDQVEVYGSGRPALTVTAGSELRFRSGATMHIGRNNTAENASYAGSLVAVGTSGEPIRFTADNDSIGGWAGLKFNNSSDTDTTISQMTHCIVEQAVNNIHVYASDTPSLENVELNDSSEWPLLLEGSGLIPTTNVSASGNADNRALYYGLINDDRVFDEAAWTSLQVVFDDVIIYGTSIPSLTILPGSELRFLPGSRLDVGYLNSLHSVYRGGLQVLGSGASPVLFTADNDSIGGWEGIRFNDASDYLGAASFMEHAVVEMAVRCLWSRYTSAPTLENVELNHSSEWPLYMEGASLPTPLNLGAAGNPDNRGLYQGLLGNDWFCDLANWSLPLLFDNTEVGGAARPVLELTAGSELRFRPGAAMHIGRNNNSENTSFAGALLAQGTEAEPILFTADNDSIGGWAGLKFNNSSDADTTASSMTHCVVERAVNNIHVYASDTPSLQDVELNDSSEWPLLLEGSGLIPSHNVSAAGNADNRALYFGLISDDRTFDASVWSSIPVVFSDVVIYDSSIPVLTILPGLELRFLPGTGLDVGYYASLHSIYRGGLDVQGSVLEPVRFTADNDSSGGWTGIRFNDASDYNGASSSMTHAVVEKAVRNITAKWTVYPALQDVELNDSSEWPLVMDGSSLLTASGLSAAGNPDNRALYRGQLLQSAVFDLAGWPMEVVFDETLVYGSAHPVLSLTPGSELRFLPGATLHIGGNNGSSSSSNLGMLAAQGTAIEPIRFTADNDSSGGWQGIRFNNSSDYADSSSTLNHCIVEQAVRGIEMVNTLTPTLEDVELNLNSERPLVLNGSGLPPAVGLSASGNGENRALCHGVLQDSATFDLPNFPLEVVFGDFYVYDSTVPLLVLEPGSELRFLDGTGCYIAYPGGLHNLYRGGMHAVGTAEAPIRFTADSGIPGSWDGLRFSDAADLGGSSSRLEHCIVEKAVTNLSLYDTMQPDTLLGVTVQEATGTGMLCHESTPLIAGCSFFDNDTGLRLENADSTVVGNDPSRSCAFLGNSVWNLYNHGPGNVGASHNAWCSPEGFTPEEMIYDQVDDPTKGLVDYLPVVAGTLLRASIAYLPDTQEIHVEWCPLIGATQYELHGSTETWFEPDGSTLIATTTDSWIDVPLASLPSLLGLRVVADLPETSALRSGNRCGEGRRYDGNGNFIPSHNLPLDGVQAGR